MMASRRKSWLRYRVILYAAVAIAVFVYRNDIDWQRFKAALPRQASETPSLILSGSGLVPELMKAVTARYQRDYPDLKLQVRGGGTNEALEDLINRLADVAFLLRPPTPAEQNLFRQVDGDTAVVAPVAVGGVLILAGQDVLPTGQLTADEVGELLTGSSDKLCRRFYAADPNLGQWAAVANLLGQDPEPVTTTNVVYLTSNGAVAEAVANDPQAIGLIVEFDLPRQAQARFTQPDSALAHGPIAAPRIMALRTADDSIGRMPTYENVANGTYPLFVSLYVACRTNGGIQGSKFVTHLASGRGQRQIERAGCIPAVQVLREIILTTEAVGR